MPAAAPAAQSRPASRSRRSRWWTAATVPALVAVLALAWFLQRPADDIDAGPAGAAARPAAQRPIMVLPTRGQGSDAGSRVSLGRSDFMGDSQQRRGLPERKSVGWGERGAGGG